MSKVIKQFIKQIMLETTASSTYQDLKNEFESKEFWSKLDWEKILKAGGADDEEIDDAWDHACDMMSYQIDSSKIPSEVLIRAIPEKLDNRSHQEVFEAGLDVGIRKQVIYLQENGFAPIWSCQGVELSHVKGGALGWGHLTPFLFVIVQTAITSKLKIAAKIAGKLSNFEAFLLTPKPDANDTTVIECAFRRCTK